VVVLKKIAVTVSAVAFVMLAIALAPNVPTALATARATINGGDAKLKQPVVEQPCAAFEAWFLDPNCRLTNGKKVARPKGRLARK
jgi:hypothetical protein